MGSCNKTCQFWVEKKVDNWPFWTGRYVLVKTGFEIIAYRSAIVERAKGPSLD